MNRPRHQLRAFLDDGPHAGRTVSIDSDTAGKAPKRIVLAMVPEAAPPGPDDREPRPRPSPGRVITYELYAAGEELGLWAYRMVDGR
ncbi:MAG TPA: hypothetical protein VL595_32400 [Pseudonocardia sp.]|jgi:hypothetical protein|nr:hypothetical protein [Pseudonocardia sp.]